MQSDEETFDSIHYKGEELVCPIDMKNSSYDELLYFAYYGKPGTFSDENPVLLTYLNQSLPAQKQYPVPELGEDDKTLLELLRKWGKINPSPTTDNMSEKSVNQEANTPSPSTNLSSSSESRKRRQIIFHPPTMASNSPKSKKRRQMILCPPTFLPNSSENNKKWQANAPFPSTTFSNSSMYENSKKQEVGIPSPSRGSPAEAGALSLNYVKCLLAYARAKKLKT